MDDSPEVQISALSSLAYVEVNGGPELFSSIIQIRQSIDPKLANNLLSTIKDIQGGVQTVLLYLWEVRKFLVVRSMFEGIEISQLAHLEKMDSILSREGSFYSWISNLSSNFPQQVDYLYIRQKRMNFPLFMMNVIICRLLTSHNQHDLGYLLDRIYQSVKDWKHENQYFYEFDLEVLIQIQDVPREKVNEDKWYYVWNSILQPFYANLENSDEWTRLGEWTMRFNRNNWDKLFRWTLHHASTQRIKSLCPPEYFMEDEVLYKPDFDGDGEYYNVDVFHYLILNELDFPIRADWTDELRKWCDDEKLIDLLDDGEDKEVKHGRVIGQGKQSQTLRLVVLNRGGELTPLVLPSYSKLKPEQALLLYEERFGIDTSFREIGLRMGFTIAHSPQYRLALFGTACAMYNLILSYYEKVVARSQNPSEWKVTLIEIMDILHQFLGDYMLSAITNEKEHNNQPDQ